MSIPDTLFNDTSRYLSIRVGGDPELTPQQRYTSVAYAHASSQWNANGHDIWRLDKIGIGTSMPSTPLEVWSSGTSIKASSATQYADAIGVKSYAENDWGYRAIGVWAEGCASAGGNSYGGAFTATNSGGYGIGVYGENTGGANGTGVYGYRAYGSGVRAESGGTGPGLLVNGWSANGIEATGRVRGIYATGGSYGIVAVATANGGAGVYGSNGGNYATYGGYFVGDTSY